MRLSRGLPALGLAAALAAASTAGAQVQPNRFTITPMGGYIHFDRASSIQSAPTVGLHADYGLTSAIGVGLSFGVSRPKTYGEDFVTSLRYGDTATYLFAVTQPLSVIDAALNLRAQLPVNLGRVSPYVSGGAGLYAIYADPDVSGGENSFSRMSANAGGGLSVRLGERAGLVVDLRDLMFFRYDRTRLDPTQVGFTNTRYPEDVPAPPAAKSTLHNFSINIGFSFAPRRSITDTDETQQGETR